MFNGTDYTTLIPWAVATGMGTAGLLIAERYGFARLRALFKTIAALSFLGAACVHHPTASGFSLWLTIGLALSVVGDICLLRQGTGSIFKLGIASFLAAHLAYLWAFITVGIDWSSAGIALILLTPLGVKIHRWLLPDLTPGLRHPVLAYLLVISAMTASSVGVWYQNPNLAGIPIAAGLFMISDVGVSIQRFKTPLFAHKLWSIPTYFGAQLMFAAHTLVPL